MTYDTIAAKVEWRGPEGFTVMANEDGVHIRSPKGDVLEPGDVTRLIELVEAARHQMNSGQLTAPRPPREGEIDGMPYTAARRYIARRAIQGVKNYLGDDAADNPF